MNLARHFKEQGHEVIEKIWGREFVVVNHPLYCGKIFEVYPMSESSKHLHRVKNETFMCTDGLIHVEIWPYGIDRMGQIVVLRGWAKDSIDIPAGLAHRFSNYESQTAWVTEFSTHYSNDDTVRFEESRRFA
jgi:uncharacterized cupin superfamily protein